MSVLEGSQQDNEKQTDPSHVNNHIEGGSKAGLRRPSRFSSHCQKPYNTIWQMCEKPIIFGPIDDPPFFFRCRARHYP